MRYGNAQIDGLPFMDVDLAMAANRVILTTERIVSNDQIRRAPDQTKIPFFAVDAVVELPYRLRAARVLRRLRADDAPHGVVRRPGERQTRSTACSEYLEQLVYGPASWTEFLAGIGVEELLERRAQEGRSTMRSDL